MKPRAAYVRGMTRTPVLLVMQQPIQRVSAYQNRVNNLYNIQQVQTIQKQ